MDLASWDKTRWREENFVWEIVVYNPLLIMETSLFWMNHIFSTAWLNYLSNKYKPVKQNFIASIGKRFSFILRFPKQHNNEIPMKDGRCTKKTKKIKVRRYKILYVHPLDSNVFIWCFYDDQRKIEWKIKDKMKEL